jgi:hypothetical protein
VTPAVTGEGAVSFQLATTSSDGINFHSRESASADLRPQLVLTVVNDAYPRPAGAGPVRVALVPAYNACVSPNRAHGSPLAHPSCDPPTRPSSALTVGTSEVNGHGTNSTGSVRLNVIAGDPGTPADEADVGVVLQLRDVRDATTFADYPGEVRMRGTLRITDRASGTAGDESGTIGDLDVPVTATCAATPEAGLGATCSVNTTLDAVIPGVIDEGERSVWELGQVEVLDGGADGDVDTPGNAVFARQGIFIP